jgi:uncharacterized membrane protein
MTAWLWPWLWDVINSRACVVWVCGSVMAWSILYAAYRCYIEP